MAPYPSPSSSTSPPIPSRTLHPSYPAHISYQHYFFDAKILRPGIRAGEREGNFHPAHVSRLRFWNRRVKTGSKVYVRDVLGSARPSSSFTSCKNSYVQQRMVSSYQTNKSTTNSFKPPISSSPPHKDLVSSGVGTLFVSSALHPISSTILFFSAVIPRKPASFQSLISLK